MTSLCVSMWLRTFLLKKQAAQNHSYFRFPTLAFCSTFPLLGAMIDRGLLFRDVAELTGEVSLVLMGAVGAGGVILGWKKKKGSIHQHLIGESENLLWVTQMSGSIGISPYMKFYIFWATTWVISKLLDNGEEGSSSQETCLLDMIFRKQAGMDWTSDSRVLQTSFWVYA